MCGQEFEVTKQSNTKRIEIERSSKVQSWRSSKGGECFLEMAWIGHLDGPLSKGNCAGTVESHGGGGNATPPPMIGHRAKVEVSDG